MPETPAGPRQYLLLVTLAAIWGSSFLFIKVAVESLPPWTLVSGRLWLAAVALLILLRLQGHRLPRDPRVWRHLVVIGAVGNLLPFFLITWGEVSLDSGMTAILMAVMPLATVLLAHFFTRDERLGWLKLIGVALGFSGVLLLVGPEALQGLGRQVLAQLAVAAAACCYAVTGIYSRVTRTTALPPTVVSAGVLLVAALLSLPFCLLLEAPWRLSPSGVSLVSLLVLGLLCTAVAYIILFHLIERAGVTFVAMNNYMIPCFGLLWGSLFLSERLQITALLALALILAGVAFTQWGGRR